MSLDKQNSRISFQRVTVSLVLFGVLYLMALRLILPSKQCPEPAHWKSLQAALPASSHSMYAAHPLQTVLHTLAFPAGSPGLESMPACPHLPTQARPVPLLPAQYSSIHKKVTWEVALRPSPTPRTTKQRGDFIILFRGREDCGGRRKMAADCPGISKAEILLPEAASFWSTEIKMRRWYIWNATLDFLQTEEKAITSVIWALQNS